MKNLLAAFVGLLLALLHAWGGPACACEMDHGSGDTAAMDCCCGHEQAPPADCAERCAELRAAAPASAPHALPDAATGLVIPAPPLAAYTLPAPALRDSPAVSARGPPGVGPPLWLSQRSLRC